MYDYDELSLPASNTHFSDHLDDTGADSYNLDFKDKDGLTVGNLRIWPEEFYSRRVVGVSLRSPSLARQEDKQTSNCPVRICEQKSV